MDSDRQMNYDFIPNDLQKQQGNENSEEKKLKT